MRLAFALAAANAAPEALRAAGLVRFDGAIKAVGATASARIVRTRLTAAELAQTQDIVITLRMRNWAELEARIGQHERIPPAEMESRYLAAASDYARLRAWLVQRGFTFPLTDAGHTSLFARARVGDIAAAFQLAFARVATPDGEFTSAVTAPSLPAAVGARVLGIVGLQPHLRRRPPRRTLAAADVIVSLGSFVTPADVGAAYSLPGSLTGAGQTISVIMDAVPLQNDLTAFYSECRIAEAYASFSAIPIYGGPTAGSQATDQAEVTLDAEWSTALAPGAQLRVYALPALNDAYFLAACATILNDGGSTVVSYSASGPEDESSADSLTTVSQTLARLAANGITVLVASGDGGSNPNPVGEGIGYSPANPLTVEYPASDPNVTGVGGTTITFGTDWSGEFETAWSPTASDSTCTGGGYSAYFTRPSWQTGYGVPGGSARCVPDVAALSTFNRAGYTGGAAVVLNGEVAGFVGTSLATPIWAGMVADMNQGRASLGLSNLGLLGPWLYPLIGYPGLHDDVTGYNGAYTAGTGYDLCTGVGSPQVSTLLTEIDEEITSVAPAPLVNAGASATMSVTPQLSSTYQWCLDGVPIAGATGASYSFSQASNSDDGAYSVVITNAVGQSTYDLGSVTVVYPPSITSQPSPQTAAVGSTVVFAVAANAGAAYQWDLNGVPISGATSARLVVSGTAAANSGTYTCVVTGDGQSVVSSPAALTLIASPASPGRLINLSVLSNVGSGDVLTLGFFTGGGTASNATQPLLIRGMGPTLANYGVPAVLADPKITLFNQTEAILASNAGWGANQAAVTAADALTGAFSPLSADSLDSAVVMPLAPGGYTVQVSASGAGSGTALAGVYDATPSGTYTAAFSRLTNLSCLDNIAGTVTAGFVVGGTTAKTVLIRASGPALALLGVPSTMADPQLTLFDGQQNILGTNAGWGGDPQIAAVAAAVGAFAYTDPASHDSVLLVTLPPGSYSAQCTSSSGRSGEALIEVYDVP